LKNPDFLLG